MLKLLKKKYFYLLIILMAILLVGFFVIFIINQNNLERKNYSLLNQVLKEQENEYKNDIYGGETPQETLNLLISALEKGNGELASQYYVLEKQEKMKEYYLSLKNEEKWPQLIEEIKLLKQKQLIWEPINDKLTYLSVEVEGRGKEPVKERVFTFRRYASLTEPSVIINPQWKID